MKRFCALTILGCSLALVIGGSARLAQECTAPAEWFPHSQTQEPDASKFPSSPTNCDFHQWAWQEFLWLTQPTGSGSLRFMQFPTPADVFQPEQQLRAVASVPKNRPLRLSPRVSKPSAPRSLSTINQAGSEGILVAPDGFAVYYATFVNDTYYNFIRTNGYNIPANLLKADPNQNFDVGSLEIKSSWRIVGDGEDTSKYYTTTAEVELLANSSQGIVVDPTQTKTVKVALLGVHVVGVVQNHPEFIWATFENNNNAPNLPAGMSPTSPDPVSAQGFTMYAANTPAAACNQFNAGELTLDQATQKLTPVTQVFRQYALTGSSDNAQNIQSLNASVQKQLGTDVFANYQLVGGIWLAADNGLKPGQANPSPQTGSIEPPPPAAAFGGLANSTMETFSQGINCFICHNTAAIQPPAGSNVPPLPGLNLNLSHILTDAYFENSQAAINAAAKKSRAAAAPQREKQ